MTDTQLILAGPALALLALLLLLIPSVRPGACACGTGWLGAAMLFPMALGYVIMRIFHSYGLIDIAFMLKPITAMLSVALFVIYLVMWRSKRLPVITSLPSLFLLCGSAADVFAIYRLGSSWGGANC